MRLSLEPLRKMEAHAMLKKGLIVAAALAVLGTFFFGRDALSYVRTSAGWVRDSVRDNVPVEFEIERARQLVRDLVPDIRRNMHTIAREEVELAQLDKEIAEGEARLAREREHVLRLRGDLAEDHDVYHYAGRSFSPQQVRVDLAARFERFQTNEATLASLREVYAARQRGLDAARQKLEGMLAAKRQLEVDIENLEARLQMIEAAETTAEYNFDDSRLARAKELIRDLRTRLEVAEQLTHSDGYIDGEIPLSEEDAADIVDQVTEYFQLGGAQVAAKTGTAE